MSTPALLARLVAGTRGNAEEERLEQNWMRLNMGTATGMNWKTRLEAAVFANRLQNRRFEN